MRSISPRMYLKRLSLLVSLWLRLWLYLPLLLLLMIAVAEPSSLLLPHQNSDGGGGNFFSSYQQSSPTQRLTAAKKLYLFRAGAAAATSPANDSTAINFAALSPSHLISRGISLHHYYGSKSSLSSASSFSSSSSSSSSLSASMHHRPSGSSHQLQPQLHSKLSHDIGRIKRSRAIRDSVQALNQLFIENGDYEILGTETGVAGGKIALPCNITPSSPNDAVSLILWYKDESMIPIYSVDARKGQSLEAARRVTDENLASRSFMDTSLKPLARLFIELISPEDAGEYGCRVDFRKERTRNSIVYVKVIIPPEKPQITDTNGEQLPSVIGPYTEGDRLSLVCEVEGGKPTPAVTWWRESVLLDDSYEAISGPKNVVLVRNQLTIGALSRDHQMASFTCQASNNNQSQPLSTTVSIELYFRPLSVKIVSEKKPLSAEKVSTISCISSGSHPPAAITWWMGVTRLKHAEEQKSPDGNTTISRLSFTANIDDIGKEVTCRAENTHIPSSAIEDTVKLDINYVPQITLRLGSNLRHSHIQEGNDVYFECIIRASPSVTEIRWHFEGRELQTNTSAGVIVSNQSLVLQKVKRNQRGRYTCSATNEEGEGESNSIHLRVQFAPVCKAGQKILYGAARYEQVSVLCEVEADPPEVNFNWSYNGSGEAHHKDATLLNFEGSGTLSSIGRFTPRTEFDYGTVFCWAANSVGAQVKPCAYSIVAAGSPDAVRNCSILNVTEDSMKVECGEGYDGGLRQHFVLEVFDTTSTTALRANLSAPTPHFSLNRLQPARSYLLVVYAANAKGRSKEMAVTAYTLAMPESMNRLAKGNVWQLNFNPVLVVLIAVVAGVVVIAFFIVLIVRWRTMKPPLHRYRGKTSTDSANNNNHSSAANNSNGQANGGTPMKEKKMNTSSGSAVFRKGMVEEICDVCTTCTPGESDDDHITKCNSDLGPDISLTSSEAATKNTDLTEESDKLTSLTTPLNGAPGGVMPGNIYTSTPLTNGSSNKHVTWRPETPPSPPPNVYTQYSNVSYVPVPTSNLEPLSYQYVGHDSSHQLVPNMTTMVPSLGPAGAGNLPMSYSLSTGLAGTAYDPSASAMATGYHVIGGGQSGTPLQYGTLGAHHHQQQQQQHLLQQQQQASQMGPLGSMGGGMMGGGMAMGSPYSPYGSYGGGGSPAAAGAFSTLQHPRRVRVLPPATSNGSMQSTPPPQLGSPATTLSMTSSGSASLSTNVQHRTSTDQLSRSPMTDV